MSISQVFVVSPRGDCVIFKDFRGDVPKVRAFGGFVCNGSDARVRESLWNP